jgi:hypothetical protein
MTIKKPEPYCWAVEGQHLFAWRGEHAEQAARVASASKNLSQPFPLYREPPAHHPDILQTALDALEGLIIKHRHTHGLDGAWDTELVKGEMAAELLRQHLKPNEVPNNIHNS